MIVKNIKSALWGGGFYRKIVTILSAFLVSGVLFYAFFPAEPEKVEVKAGSWLPGSHKSEEAKPSGALAAIGGSVNNGLKAGGEKVRELVYSKPAKEAFKEPSVFAKPFIWMWKNKIKTVICCIALFVLIKNRAFILGTSVAVAASGGKKRVSVDNSYELTVIPDDNRLHKKAVKRKAFTTDSIGVVNNSFFTKDGRRMPIRSIKEYDNLYGAQGFSPSPSILGDGK